MDYSAIIDAHFPLRSLKLAPEVKVMSLVKSVDYPITITNDNAPYALPYWHSQVLARFILDNPTMFSGHRILDIGCGCGAASVAAAMVGARAIALDPDLRCLDFTERNAKLNGVEVELVWGTHKIAPDVDIILAGGVFHEAHGVEIAEIAKGKPSLIAVSQCDLWGMSGFTLIAEYDMGLSHIMLYRSNHMVGGDELGQM